MPTADYREKLDRLADQTLLPLLEPREQRFVRRVAADYRFTFQELRRVAEAARDLEMWREQPLGEWWRRAEEAVALANASIYGLAAGVWTRDVGKAHRVAAQLQAGTVWINQYNWYDSGAPFGGFKQSGYGRELGKAALDYYTETKTVFVGT